MAALSTSKTKPVQIVLASASPRRRELLAQIAVRCFVCPVDLDESVQAGEAPTEYVQRLALAKARLAQQNLSQQSELADYKQLPVLGSDTTVAVDDEILGKPADSAHAAEILSKLSDREHAVYTAVSLLSREGALNALSCSKVRFAPLSAATIQQYIATGEPMDKAGAYAIQGRAAQFITQISGSYSGVMGLPLYETAALLQKAEINPLLLA